MANYQQLKEAISEVIRKNGKQLITGEILQSVLLQMVNIIGKNATFAGIADTQTAPGMPDANVFYMAFESGDYPNFGGAKLPIDSIGIFENSTGEWVSHVYTFAAGKINKTDIADNITTNDGEKVLSAKQGVVVKSLIDSLQELVNTNTKSIKNNSTAITQQGNTIQAQQQTITQQGKDISTQAGQISQQSLKLLNIEKTVTSIGKGLTQHGETIATQGKIIEEQGRTIKSQSSDIQSLKTGKQNTLVSGENIKSINGESVVGSGNVVINPTIMDLKWTTNAATTRKLVPEELRAKDVRIAYTNNSGVYIVEKYKAESIDDASWADNANWKGCRTPLTPTFEARGAVFNDDTGFYEYNTLTDLTENEMISIDKYSAVITEGESILMLFDYCKLNLRTIFPVIISSDLQYDLSYSFRGVSNFQVIRIYYRDEPMHVKNLNGFGLVSTNIRKVLDIFRIHSSYTKDIKLQIPNIEYIRLMNIRQNITIQSSKINYESLRYWIDNSANTSAITITVHPTTYGYLTGTIEPTEQVGGTTEEWQQILADAAEKQISFATT